MLSRLPVGTRVVFQGVDWDVETEKSQQGLERRKKARQRSAQRKMRQISDSQLLSFLRFVIKEESDQSAFENMDACPYLLRRVRAKGFGEKRVDQLPEMFDSLKNDGELRALISSWVNAAVSATLYTVLPDDAPTRTSPDSPSGGSLDYSVSNTTISTKGSQQSDKETSQASQVTAVDLDLNKVREFGQVIAFLETTEIEEQLKALNMQWETISWKIAQVHVNEIIKKIEALALNPESDQDRVKALASFEKVTDYQTRVHFLRWALRENITAAVLSDSIADKSGSTRASSAAVQDHGPHPH
jgi:hypothetical protein